MTITFSPLDSASGQPDKMYSFGQLDEEDYSLRETITIAQEILGVYFIPNNTPDYEGIYFYLEDGSFVRVGMDQIYTPNLSDFTMLDARLIGFSAKFGPHNTNFINSGYLGLISDQTSCEGAIYSAPNPFTSMTIDFHIGTTST